MTKAALFIAAALMLASCRSATMPEVTVVVPGAAAEAEEGAPSLLSGVYGAEVSGIGIELAFRDDGSVSFSCPSQLLYDAPCEIDDEGTILVPSVGASISGDIPGDALYTQGEHSEKTTFTLLSEDPEGWYKRPQDPESRDYLEEEVAISAEDGAMLAGTLSSIDGDTSRHAVVLLSGSGAQDRDSKIANHRPFLVISDALVREGFATLRCDDRGAGSSSPASIRDTTFTNASDAKAQVDFLRSLGYDKISLLGHSEGGVAAAILAAEDPGIASVVLLGTPAVDGLTTVLDQNRTILLATTDRATADTLIATFQLAIQEAMQGDREAAVGLLSNVLGKEAAQAQYDAIASPWHMAFLSLDPSEYLREVRCPVLALYGGKDTQVSAALNAGAMGEATRGAGKGSEVLLFANANHLFQNCGTGAVTEYGLIEETISPEALSAIVGWLKER